MRVSDYPLRVQLKGSVLEISIGLGTLVQAAKFGEQFGKQFESGQFRIPNQRTFGNAVVDALLEDNGGNPLTEQMFDRAIERVIAVGDPKAIIVRAEVPSAS